MTKTKTRQLLISSAVAVVGLLAAIRFDAFESFAAWVRRYDEWRIDEFFFVALFGVILLLYYWRRREELEREVAERGRVEEELRRQKDLYEGVLTAQSELGEGFVVLEDRRIRYANEAFCKISGYDPVELRSLSSFMELVSEESDSILERQRRLLSDGEEVETHYDTGLRRKDGRLVDIEVAFRMLEEDGRTRIVVIVRDITERKRAENKLGKAEERYRTLIEQVPGIIYVRDVAGSNTNRTSPAMYTSPQIEAQSGYPPQAFVDDPELWVRRLHPEDRERVLAEDRRTDETGEPFEVEYRQFARDGRMVWVRDEAVLVRDEEGNPSYWLGIQHDITERKRAEEALRESELRLRTVISNVPVVLFALDIAGVITLSEGKGMGALGFEPGEIVGRSVSEVFGDVPQLLNDIDRVLAGEEFSAVREVNSRTFEMWYSPVRASTREVSGVIGVATDVTERERAQKALKGSEERYRLVTRATNEVIWDHDLTTNAQVWDGAIEAMFGYSPEQVGVDAGWWEDLIHPEDRERVLSGIEAVLEEGGEMWSDEYRFRRADGGYSVVVDQAYVMRDAGGRPVRMIGSMMDVTERKRAEEALRRSEAGLAEAQRMAHLGSWEWDVVTDEVRWSDEVFRIYGFEPGSFVPTLERLLEVVHPDDRELLKAAIDGALYRGEPYDFEHRIVRPDGEERVVHRRAEVARDEDGEPIKMIGTAHDITERKRAEERLREANRRLEELAALRTDFTAMVAHEIGSPLASVRGFLEVLATGELEPDDQTDVLVKIRAEINRLSTLVADVRSAATIEHDDFALLPRRTAVDELFEDAVQFAETLPGDHPLTIKVEENGRVWADPYRIGQVLRNLLSNAAKYSPEGAPIELRARSGEIPGRIRIEVADRGRGVHPDDVDVIFEKFGRGRDRRGMKAYGVGLGLYLSRRILRAHGGELKLDPAPKEGSVFSFELEEAA